MNKTSIITSALAGLAALLISSCGSTSDVNLLTKQEARRTSTGTPHTFATAARSSFLPAPADPTVAAQAAHLPKDRHGAPTYTDLNDRHRYVRTTAYSHMENEPGAPGRLNAAGTTLLYGNNVRSAAADWSLYPLGTKFKIKGLPYTYVVDDYGSELVGTNTIDIFHPSLSLMNKWGTRHTEINVIQWGDFQRSAKLLSGRKGYWHCKQMYANIMDRLNTDAARTASVSRVNTTPGS